MREKRGGCDSGRRYPNSVTTLLRRRVSRRERGGVRIRDRVIHLFRFLITRRVYVKALRKTTHLALRSLAQCYAMNVSPVKKKLGEKICLPSIIAIVFFSPYLRLPA